LPDDCGASGGVPLEDPPDLPLALLPELYTPERAEVTAAGKSARLNISIE
jgi:hypothetical protein